MTSVPWRGTKVHFVPVKPGQSSSTWDRHLRPAHSILAALVVVTRYGYAMPCSRIEIIEASHPVPDAASVTAAQRIHPAKVITQLISDVPGGRPMDIASGPTVADATTCADALAIVKRYGITLPAAALNALQSGRGESIKPGDARLAASECHFVATPQMAPEAAAELARNAGVAVHILGDSIEGEALDVGKVIAGIALQVARQGEPLEAPCVLLSGGETTATFRGHGRGGRNVEFLLSLAIALDGHAAIHALAGDTDGVDGREEIAGAHLAPDSLARAWALGIKPRDSLADNDGHGFFQALGDSVVTGPTLTNVNDFRAVFVGVGRGWGA